MTFIDSQDLSRFLSVNNSQNRLNEALAFQLTTRGIPVIYYGDEQYLHNDTRGGNDPYNRPQMVNFSTTTTAYTAIQQLSALRQTNDAIAYGTSKQRYLSSDVYIYERQFYNNVVLVAISYSFRLEESDRPGQREDEWGRLRSAPPGSRRPLAQGHYQQLRYSARVGSDRRNRRFDSEETFQVELV